MEEVKNKYAELEKLLGEKIDLCNQLKELLISKNKTLVEEIKKEYDKVDLKIKEIRNKLN